ncbi:hypothetical protein [Actinoplanes ianthinogenes]|uniref:hypothetical protein n=1 Tax=Actinoplanes ianthinogenes TaxID=122358 RepID=UPI001670C9E3|nr:hypothetical protein [Actinoplanes ianthinogenes]
MVGNAVARLVQLLHGGEDRRAALAAKGLVKAVSASCTAFRSRTSTWPIVAPSAAETSAFQR